MGIVADVKKKAKGLKKSVEEAYAKGDARRLRMQAAADELKNREKIRALAPKEPEKQKAMTKMSSGVTKSKLKAKKKLERWQSTTTSRGGGRIAANPGPSGY